MEAQLGCGTRKLWGQSKKDLIAFFHKQAENLCADHEELLQLGQMDLVRSSISDSEGRREISAAAKPCEPRTRGLASESVWPPSEVPVLRSSTVSSGHPSTFNS